MAAEKLKVIAAEEKVKKLEALQAKKNIMSLKVFQMTDSSGFYNLTEF